MHRAVVVAEGLVDADLVDHEQVAALAGQLGPGVVEHRAVAVAGLGREPDDDRRRALPRAATSPASTSGLRTSSTVGADRRGPSAVGLLDLVRRRSSAGRKSATAAAMTTTSASRGGLRDRVGSSSAVSTGTTVTPSGAGSDDGGDQRDLGAALGGGPGQGVALLARGAVAQEAHRVERLAGAAGG